MTSISKNICGSLIIAAMLSACGDNKKEEATATFKTDSSAVMPAKDSAAAPATTAQDGPAIATLTAPSFVAKVHNATAFVPTSTTSIFKVKPRHRFVVLNMSIRNTSDKEIDMGQILLMTKVTDDKGKDFPLYPGAISAYEHEHPDPQHQLNYTAMWHKMKPGAFYRTEIFGIEVPEGTKNLTISMNTEDDLTKKVPIVKASFTIE